MTRLVVAAAGVAAALVVVVTATGQSTQQSETSTRQGEAKGETIYIRNLAPRYITDAEIRRSIPAWEHAVNVDFAGYWHTAQFNLKFIGRRRAPFGAINATFVKKGPIKGALAYHNTENGAPSIMVYAGTGAYYGYDNSVSFTHELFELAADPLVSNVIQGWPYDYIWLERQDGSIRQGAQFGTIGWFGEVADPVEADSYLIDGVRISDFITPSWFNEASGTRFDFMGVCQQPFWIRPGGYAQYMDAIGWNIVTNFRAGHASDRGFFKSDPRQS